MIKQAPITFIDPPSPLGPPPLRRTPRPQRQISTNVTPQVLMTPINFFD